MTPDEQTDAWAYNHLKAWLEELKPTPLERAGIERVRGFVRALESQRAELLLVDEGVARPRVD